jgi:hypothetical protein
MWKSKALLLAESGREKLCYDVCRACKKKCNGILDDTGDPWIDKMRDEDFGEYFIGSWERRSISCPEVMRTIDPVEEPPKACPHWFEHLVGMSMYGKKKSTTD